MTGCPEYWAIVPAKSLSMAKQRLASRLDAKQRARLARAMLRDVLHCATQCRALAGVVLVTADSNLAAIGREAGAMVVGQSTDEGINAAVQAAIHSLHADGVLVLPG